MPPESNLRVLIIDDNCAIHSDFHKILNISSGDTGDLAEEEAAIFGDAAPAAPAARFEIDSAYQGEEGFKRVQQSLTCGRPYAMAFVDMRMPPGWDGLETVARIWAVDPDIQIVLCTAYSDASWEDVIARLGKSDQLLILKKPFNNIEAMQLATSLTTKWMLLRQGKMKVQKLIELHANEERRREALERELVQIKSQPASIFQHELRCPLEMIKAAARSLVRNSDRMSSEERSVQIQEILGAAERMAQMLEGSPVLG